MDNWGGRQSRKTIKCSGDLLSGACCKHHTQAKPEALRFLLLKPVCSDGLSDGLFAPCHPSPLPVSTGRGRVGD